MLRDRSLTGSQIPESSGQWPVVEVSTKCPRAEGMPPPRTLRTMRDPFMTRSLLARLPRSATEAVLRHEQEQKTNGDLVLSVAFSTACATPLVHDCVVHLPLTHLQY